VWYPVNDTALLSVAAGLWTGGHWYPPMLLCWTGAASEVGA
jgi:hypothetical protein